MKQKQVTFVLMLMSIFLSCVFNVKAQIPSSDDYTDEMLDYLQQNHNEYPETDNFYPENSGTDYAKTKIAIKKAFNAWQARSDFETSEEYETRLRDNSVAKFDELCIKYVRYTVWDKTWAFDPVKYNIDKQEYTIDFYESYHDQIYSKFFKIRIVVPMETDVARRYKHLGDFEAYQVKTYYSLFFMINEKFVPSFFSHRFLYIDNSNYSSAKEITFTAAGCGISNKYLTGYTCHVCEIWKNQTARFIAYVNAKKQREIEEKERKRLDDSLAIVNYNKQIVTLYSDSQKKLQENKYNIDKLSMSSSFFDTLNYACISPKYYDSYLSRIQIDSKYKERIRAITNEYQKKSEEIERNYSSYKELYTSLFENETEFDKYYCQGLNVLQSKVDDIKTMRFFEEYIKRHTEFENVNLHKEYFYIIEGRYNEFKTEIRKYLTKHNYKDYYPRMISLILEKNRLMKNEYARIGFLFKDEIDFYDVYKSYYTYTQFIKLHKKEIKVHNQGKK